MFSKTGKKTLLDSTTCTFVRKMLVNNRLEAEIELQQLGIGQTQMGTRFEVRNKYLMQGLKATCLKLRRPKEGEEPYLDNIWIYENEEEINGEHFRVVVLPLQKDIIKADAQRE